MRLTMKMRKSLTKVFRERYKHATKLEKTLILNEYICHICHIGFNRNYAARALRNMKSQSRSKTIRKKSKPLYDEPVKLVLEKLWKLSDCMCGKRLVSVLPELIKKTLQFQELTITDEVKQKPEKIRPATIDRLLHSCKKSPKGSSMTKSTH